jgi:CRP/FNR family cyclic AMP-dependent transcriptional regulator
MKTMREIIAEQPFFRGLESGHLDLIAGCAANARFNAGQRILQEGAPAETFFLLTGGRAAVEVYIAGRGARIVHTAAPGEPLGWSWLFPPYRWSADAHAVELVTAIVIDGRCLRDKAAADHDLGYELMRRFASVVIKELEETRLQLVDMYAHAGGR